MADWNRFLFRELRAEERSGFRGGVSSRSRAGFSQPSPRSHPICRAGVPARGGRSEDSSSLHPGGRRPVRRDRLRSPCFRDQEPRRFDRLPPRERGSPRRVVAGRHRHPCPEVLPQGRRERAGRRRRRRPGAPARGDQREAGVPPPRRVLDPLGPPARLLRHRRRRPGLLRRDELHAGRPGGGAQLAAVVQHRAALRLRHQRAGPGSLLRRSEQRRDDRGRQRLRASAAARLLHPVGLGRPGEPRRHHGPVGARGAPVQVRLGHRERLLAAARRERIAVGRRPLVGAHVVPAHRRSRRGRDQVRRHDAPRGQDGRAQGRPSRHRGVRRLEGGRGAEGRRPRRRLARLPPPPADHPRRDAGEARRRPRGRARLRPRGRRRRDRDRSGEERRAQERGPRRARRVRARGLHPARAADGGPGRDRGRLPRVRHRLGRRRLRHRVGPELEQLGAHPQRLLRRARRRRRLEADPPHRRQGRAHGPGAQAVGQDLVRRVGLRRSGPAVRHDDQRVAHLPEGRADQRVATRAPSTSSSTTPPATWPRSTWSSSSARTARSTSRATATPSACGRSRSRSRSSWRRSRPSRSRASRSSSAPLGLGYANLGTLLMRQGLAVRLAAGAGHRRRADGDPHRRGLRGLGRDGLGAGAVRRLRAQQARDAARHPQPSPRHLRRLVVRVRGPVGAAAVDRRRVLPRGHARRGTRRVGPRAAPGRAARLPQRAGHGDRAHGHDRPGDGLRHDRHRARLRAREVQEARRRRLLQDREPEPAHRAHAPGLRRGGDRPHRQVLRRPRHARRRPRREPPDAGRARLHARGDREDRGRPRLGVRPQDGVQPVRARPRVLRREAGPVRGEDGRAGTSTSSRRSGSRPTRSRPPTSTCAAR